MAGLGTFISVGRSLDTALERVKRAEVLGFDSTYVTHIAARDSLSVLMAYASVTERIRLGTGVIPIFSRTPVAMAQGAATIDEFSGGRMVLGIGVSHRVTVENWYGQEISKPLAQMREYAQILRAMFRGEDPPAATYFQTNFRFMGLSPRPDLPIYIAGLSPKMLQLAGEIADGVVLWLCNPAYIRDVVVPAVTEGRAKAGLELEGFDIVAAVPSAVTDEPEAVRSRMRQELIPYASLPFYRAMLERSGFADDLAAFDAGMGEGNLETATAGLSDELIDALAPIGSPDDVRAGLQRYLGAGANSPCVGPIGGSDFDATIEAAAGLL